MVIDGHFCPPLGRSCIGDEFDCPRCRALLLEAFRTEPRTDYRPGGLPGSWHPSQGPQMIPGERLTAGLRDLHRCTRCAHREHSELYCSDGCDCSHGWPVRWEAIPRQVPGHWVRYAVSGGHWRAVCHCGLTEHGFLAYQVLEDDPETMARAWGDNHLNHPEGHNR